MTAHADEFQTLSDTLFHWSFFEPSLKCDIGCAALRLGSGLIVIDPVPLADAAWKELLAIAPASSLSNTLIIHFTEIPTKHLDGL